MSDLTPSIVNILAIIDKLEVYTPAALAHWFTLWLALIFRVFFALVFFVANLQIFFAGGMAVAGGLTAARSKGEVGSTYRAQL